VFSPSRFTTLDSDEVRLHPMQVNLADGRVHRRGGEAPDLFPKNL